MQARKSGKQKGLTKKEQMRRQRKRRNERGHHAMPSLRRKCEQTMKKPKHGACFGFFSPFFARTTYLRTCADRGMRMLSLSEEASPRCPPNGCFPIRSRSAVIAKFRRMPVRKLREEYSRKIIFKMTKNMLDFKGILCYLNYGQSDQERDEANAHYTER